jgi:membrane-associated phospholipid phosphatase
MVTSVSARTRRRGPRTATPAGISVELILGMGSLLVAAVAGLAFVHRPWPNRLDVLGYRLLPADMGSHWANDVVMLGSVTALVVGAVAIFLVGVMRDWVRAVACAAAPVVAVVIVQELAKPMVDRHLGLNGPSSYPSGTVAAIAALATAATLVVPRLLRPLVAGAGLLAVLATGAAVIVLRWHYPTDALGGIAVGVGAVLSLDGLLHVPWAVPRSLDTHRLTGGGVPRSARLAET